MKNILVIIFASIMASCTSQNNKLQFINEVSKQWIGVTNYKQEQVVLNPCDAANDTMTIEKKEENEYVLVVMGGHDFVRLPILRVTKENDQYTFHCIENDTETVFILQITDADKGTGTWNDVVYVAIEKKDNFKEIDQPCKECFDDCDS